MCSEDLEDKTSVEVVRTEKNVMFKDSRTYE